MALQSALYEYTFDTDIDYIGKCKQEV